MLDISTVVYQLPIEVDSNKIINEIDSLIMPKIGKNAGDCAVTGTDSTDLDQWFLSNRGILDKVYDPNTKRLVLRDFVKYPNTGLSVPWQDDFVAINGDGNADQDLTKWHPSMVNSEMFNLKDRIANYLKIDTALRCRCSFLNGPRTIPRHSDPHTPWRAHINLKSGPGTEWIFFDEGSEEPVRWRQPGGTVWLMRTGNVEHSVHVPPGEIRWQLFYHIWQKDLGPNYYQYP